MYLPTTITTLTTATPYLLSTFANPSNTFPELAARSALLESSSCPVAGKFMCNGPGLFGVCSNGNVLWQPTAQGTSCSCNQGECSIIAGDDDTTFVSVTPPRPTPDPSPSHKPSPSSSSPVPTATATADPGSASSTTYIKTFLGDGSAAQGWPTQSDWLSFDELWSRNLGIIQGSCEQFDQKNNSPEEIAQIKSALLSESQSTKLDARFALAALLQESGGCLRTPSTTSPGGVSNPGPYQSHDGTSCEGEVPCPEAKINQMIEDGIDGTPAGDGYLQCLQQSNDSGAQAYYEAARCYNSGSVAPSGALQQGLGATNCYVSDVANRLLGWNQGPTGCTLDDA